MRNRLPETAPPPSPYGAPSLLGHRMTVTHGPPGSDRATVEPLPGELCPAGGRPPPPVSQASWVGMGDAHFGENQEVQLMIDRGYKRPLKGLILLQYINPNTNMKPLSGPTARRGLYIWGIHLELRVFSFPFSIQKRRYCRRHCFRPHPC